jgi:hypothetical protein
MVIHVPCQRDTCGHAWNVHAIQDGKCRVTGCACEAYIKVPEPPERTDGQAETLEEAARRLEAGQIVILVPFLPDGDPEAQLAQAQLSILQTITGAQRTKYEVVLVAVIVGAS